MSSSQDPVVITGVNYGIVNTGNAQVNVYGSPINIVSLPDAIKGPEHLTNVPPGPKEFVGRDRELRALDEALTAGDTAVVIVRGGGGIGKSSLVAKYLEAHSLDYQVTWRINADDRESIDEGMADLAASLDPGSRWFPMETMRERAAQWLASHSNWLIVLDNVDDPNDIRPLVDGGPRGRFIVTSRNSAGWKEIGSQLHVAVLEPIEAERLLRRIIGESGHSDDAIRILASELNHLPLAIEQAGAYIRSSEISPVQYLRLLASYQDKLPSDTQGNVAKVLAVTMDHLLVDASLAVQLLGIISFYNPKAIPLSLLDELTDAAQLRVAITRLAAYSLIDIGNSTISVHPLVQELARRHGPQFGIDLHQACVQATTLLVSAIPDSWEDPATWPTWRRLVPHIQALATKMPPDDDTPPSLQLFRSSALFLGEQGTYDVAIELAIRAYDGARRLLDAGDSAVASYADTLADIYKTTGDLGRALPLYEATLADRERVLGPDHPDTLTSRNNLAYAYQAAGDLGRALPLYEATLADTERVLGPDHPNTLVSRNNLAAAYAAAGDLGRAVPLYEATLVDRQRVLGPDHLSTRASRRNLAMVLAAVGRTEDAILLYEEIATRSLKAVGAEHSETRQAQEEARRLRMMTADPGESPVVGGGHGEG